MFCDLVGSTALSERLDPEELSDVILAYREVVAAAVALFDGYVARYVGDGVLIYFGYPRAHGDDPVRALHAALEILAGMRGLAQSLKTSQAFSPSVRIGVHTGLVVVGELARGAVREEAGVVGETPNLAARLMELATPNSVCVSNVTFALAKNNFECREVGATRLKGLSRPINIYEVISARTREGVVEFSEKTNVTALTGREHEVSFLSDRWRQVLEGRGQVVALIGEPGIGKSRLVRAFADSLDGTEHLTITFYCSPYFSNSALFPVVEYLHRWLEKSGVNKLEQLADAVATVGMSPGTVVPVIASLLSLPIAAPYESPQISARIQRDLTMEFLLGWITHQARSRPTLLVVEDLHWADASSLELVHLLLNQIQSTRILVLLAFRPEFRASLLKHSQVAHLPLDRLTTRQVYEMVEHVAGGKRLPALVCDQLVAKTDGVPLFVEELTKAVVESTALVASDEGNQPSAASVHFDIPISLHATLMARLDSLGSGKAVAQRAAILGREFSYELIAATTRMAAPDLDHGLAQLVEAELLFQRGLPPRANYVFKHSMIQEAAYRSLLRAERQRYHLQIAEVLAAQFPQTAETQPELVAHHYSAAHVAIEAARYWRKAGELALARSANIEGYAHIDKGLAELSTCLKSSSRVKEEVMLLIALGSVLTATKGSAAPEVEQTYARARDLCRELEDPAYLFPVLRGLQSFYVVHGPLRTACEMVEQLREMAEQTGNALQRVEAHRRLGWCLFCMGQIDSGRAYLDKAMQEYDRAQSPQHIVTYGSDPAIIGLVNLAWLEWFAGQTDRALRCSKQSIALARDLSYGLGMAYALGMSAALYQCLADCETTAALAEETIELAERHGFPYWIAWETSLLGWARAVQGQVDIGMEMLERGLTAYRATGAELFCPYMFGLLAQINLRVGRYDKALAFCEEALASGERTDAHFFDSEIHRLEGECLFSRDHDIAAAEMCFEEAIAVARKQGARLLELRGAMYLALLRYFQGRLGGACSVLSEAIAGFDGSQSAPDLAQARRLLAQWHESPTTSAG
jgi:class 3 adenylate cyclase/predicted ATPase